MSSFGRARLKSRHFLSSWLARIFITPTLSSALLLLHTHRHTQQIQELFIVQNLQNELNSQFHVIHVYTYVLKRLTGCFYTSFFAHIWCTYFVLPNIHLKLTIFVHFVALSVIVGSHRCLRGKVNVVRAYCVSVYDLFLLLHYDYIVTNIQNQEKNRDNKIQNTNYIVHTYIILLGILYPIFLSLCQIFQASC